MKNQRMNAGVGGNYLEKITRGGITIKYTIYIFFKFFKK